jgi:hypothetical protein
MEVRLFFRLEIFGIGSPLNLFRIYAHKEQSSVASTSSSFHKFMNYFILTPFVSL